MLATLYLEAFEYRFGNARSPSTPGAKSVGNRHAAPPKLGREHGLRHSGGLRHEQPRCCHPLGHAPHNIARQNGDDAHARAMQPDAQS